MREIELDFIRGIAILLVMAFHYTSHLSFLKVQFLSRVAECGWVGVDVFFVLSGFLVGGLLLKEWKTTGTVNAQRFLKRRAFKIWPAYYIFVLTAALIHVRPLKSFFWQNLLNIQNYVPTTLAHTWSLAVEEHFYLLLVLGMALFARRRWTSRTLLTACVVIGLAVEVLRAVLVWQHSNVYTYTHTRIDALLMGVALSTLRYFHPEQFASLQRQRVLLWAVLAVACLMLYAHSAPAPYPFHMTSPLLITVVDYGSAALLLLLYRPSPNHSQPYRLVARMGVFSYGIYLWHVSVVRIVEAVVQHMPPALAYPSAVLLPYVLAIGLGVLATKLVELPGLRLRERMVPAPQLPALELADAGSHSGQR